VHGTEAEFGYSTAAEAREREYLGRDGDDRVSVNVSIAITLLVSGSPAKGNLRLGLVVNRPNAA